MSKVIELVIDNQIHVRIADIKEEEMDELLKEFKYSNPEYWRQKAIRKRAPAGIPMFFTSFEITKKEILFQRGCIHKLRRKLNAFGYKIKIIDKRLFVPLDKPFANHAQYPLRDYQDKCIQQLSFFQQGLMKGVCGCGKTEVGSELARILGQWTLVLVDKKRLLKQWRKRVAKRFGLKEEDIGIWGDGEKTIKPITIGLVQSVIKDTDELCDRFGCIIVDECHHSPAETFDEIISSFPAAYRFGLSATMDRKDGKHVLIYDAFGKVVAEVTKEMLKERGLIHDAEIIIVPTEFTCEAYKGMSKNKAYNYLLKNMIIDKGRNKLIYDYVSKELENGHYVLMLSDRIRFCRNWKKWLAQKNIESRLLIGPEDAESEEALELLEDGFLHCVIGTTVADEGLDAPILDRGFGTTPTATHPSRLIQQVGRIERIHEAKKDAKFYYFWDKNIDEFVDHPRSILRKFNNVSIVLQSGEILKLNEDGKVITKWTQAKKIIFQSN